MSNFLQEHYNRYRRAGGDHASYIVMNDIDDNKKLCKELETEYEKTKK